MKDTNDDLSLIQQVAELHDKTAFDHLVRKYQSPIRASSSTRRWETRS